jgi:hypothetical protein
VTAKKLGADLDAMLALPAMALSMGDGGSVVDPMATTLAVAEATLRKFGIYVLNAW